MTAGIKQRANTLEKMDLSAEVPEIEANPSPHKNPKIGEEMPLNRPQRFTVCIVALNVRHHAMSLNCNIVVTTLSYPAAEMCYR